MDWLKMIAPTLATAIAGPFGGMAYGIVAKVMGITPEDAQKTIETGKLTAEQIASVQTAEIELKAKALELKLNFEELAVKDRASARDMQKETKSYVPPMLAGLVTLGFFGILLGLMLGYAKQSNELLVMLGSLGTAWTGIIAFYFGSSSGSQAKDKLLYSSTPAT